MNKTKRAYRSTIRIAKEESAFLYFQLESNEGLCFYSTIPAQNGDPHRDIVITCDLSTKEEMLQIIAHLGTKFKIEKLSEEDIDY